MSKKAAGKGRAVLEAVGLDLETIAACFNSHPLNEEEAVQAGLIEWCSDQGDKFATWGVLFAAMEYAQMELQHVRNLKKETGLFGKQCVTDVHACMNSACVCVHTIHVYMCVHMYVHWMSKCVECNAIPRLAQISFSYTFCQGSIYNLDHQ